MSKENNEQAIICLYLAIQYCRVVLCHHWYDAFFPMVDYAIAYIFWIGIAVVILKVVKDSIKPQ